MIDKQTLIDILAPRLQETPELFLVEVKVSKANKITVLVDSLKGLAVSDCISLSRHLEQHLDREKEDFELEVSSPGATEPLALPQQYTKNLGRELKATTLDGTVLQGTLHAADAEGFSLMPKPKKATKSAPAAEPEPIRLAYAQVKQAKVVLKF